MAPNPKAPKGRQVEHRNDHRLRRLDVLLLFYCELRSPGFQEFRGVQSLAPGSRVDLSTFGVGPDVLNVAGIGGDAGESQVFKKALKL